MAPDSKETRHLPTATRRAASERPSMGLFGGVRSPSPEPEESAMRMMMKVQMDTEAASRAIADGSLQQLMQGAMARLSPEAAYFGPDDGFRTAFIVFDMQDPSQ